jgi:hypothetical protein
MWVIVREKVWLEKYREPECGILYGEKFGLKIA